MIRRDPEHRRFLASHPGTPLGRGYPSGGPSRRDGESHRQAWERVVRGDPCAYCGTMGAHGFGARTVDHIVPRDPLVKPPVFGGKFDWLNVTGCCASCNAGKNAMPLLMFLRKRVYSLPRERLAA